MVTVPDLVEAAEHISNDPCTGVMAVLARLDRRCWQASVLAGETVHADDQTAMVTLHRLLYGSPCENDVWTELLYRLAVPLPVSVAIDLFDRNIAALALGHSRQTDAVQWLLAERYDEALLSLARDRYTRSEYSDSDFAEVLRRFPEHRGLLSSLAGWDASATSKHVAYLEAAQRSSLWRELEPVIASFRDTAAAARPDLTENQAQALFRLGEPRVLRALAENPLTPSPILEHLATLEHVPFARQTRLAARRRLQERGSERSATK